MTCIVDTGVPVVANESDPEDLDCQLAAIEFIEALREGGRLALDADGRILSEYRRHLDASGAPGPGDRFLKWVSMNEYVPEVCDTVSITPLGPSDKHGYGEIPEALSGMDPADMKFVAVSLTHADNPPIVVAADSDWLVWREPIETAGAPLNLLCEDLLKRQVARKAVS
jgi:hypothetical protein